MEVVNNLTQLVQNTNSLDQTMMNFDVLVGIVNISRQIITTIEQGEEVIEVRIVLVKRYHQNTVTI